MYTKMTTVINETGLHARPASIFVKTAAKFKSKIRIQKEGSDKAVDAKSIIFVLGQGMSKGTNVIISAEGEDETEAVDTLVELIDSGFGE